MYNYSIEKQMLVFDIFWPSGFLEICGKIEEYRDFMGKWEDF